MPDVQPRPSLRSRDKDEILWEGHPSPLGQLAFYRKWMGIAVALSSLLILAAYVGVLGVAPVALLVLLLCAGVEMTARLIRLHTTYQVTRRRLYTHTGILRKDTESNPLNSVVQVKINQSLTQRLLKVGTVDFDTAAERINDRGEGAPFMDWWGIRNPQMVAAIVHDLIDENDASQHIRHRRTGDRLNPPQHAGESPSRTHEDSGPFLGQGGSGFQWRDADEVDEESLGEDVGLPVGLRDDIVRYDD